MSGSKSSGFRLDVRERRGLMYTEWVQAISRFDEGGEARRYIEVPNWARGSFAVAPDGGVYVSMFGQRAEEHFIVALTADGVERWTAIMPWQAELYPAVTLRVDGRGRLWVFPTTPLDADRTTYTAWVFTGAGELIGAGSLELPGAELIGSLGPSTLELGTVGSHWQVADGEHVYGQRENPRTGEWEVIRYRLEVTFP